MRKPVKPTSQDFYRAVFEQGPELSICIEPDTGKILACSRAAQAIIGYKPADILGHPLSELVAQPIAEIDETWRAIAHCREVFETAVRVRHKYFGSVGMVVKACGVWDRGGRLLCGVAVFRNNPAEPRATRTMRTEREQLRAMAYEITLIESRERERLAREIHDGMGQIISVISFKLRQLWKSPGDGDQPILDELVSLLDRLSRGAHELIFELGNPLLKIAGLKASIESLGEQLLENSDIGLHVTDDSGSVRAPDSMLSTLLRIVREALINARKYSQARNVEVTIRRMGGDLVVVLADDGIGFDPDRLPGFSRVGGFGLHSAKIQALALGGELGIESVAGSGTRITVRLPLG